MVGHSDSIAREPARGRRPRRADQVVVGADPARGDDDRARGQLERLLHGARAGHRALGAVRDQHVAPDAGDTAVGGHQAGHPVAEPHVDQALAAAVEQGADERLEDARPGAPRDVEPRYGVAVPVGQVAAALGPLDQREPAHALGVQPRA